MSIESAKAFFSKMATYETFRIQLEQAASKEKRQQILQAADYEFTSQEWEAAEAQFQTSNANSELSDSELQIVSSGVLLLPAYGTPAIFDNITDKGF